MKDEKRERAEAVLYHEGKGLLESKQKRKREG